MKRLLKGAIAVLALGITTIGALLIYLLVERSRQVDLPIPTGSFTVGRAVYDWRDDTAIDALAPTPGTKRESLFGSGIRRTYTEGEGDRESTSNHSLPLRRWRRQVG